MSEAMSQIAIKQELARIARFRREARELASVDPVVGELLDIPMSDEQIAAACIPIGQLSTRQSQLLSMLELSGVVEENDDADNF